jgi:ariadne-1
MGDWTDHGANTGGYYKCNKYDEDIGGSSSGDDLTDAAKAKRELDRYLHYYKRFHAHAEAQKFARKQLKETENRMVLLQESSDDVKWSDVEFLKTANEQLVECRRVLKYSYVFAYYLKPQFEMQKQRFEHHQEMLERFTETLSELSEKPLAEMDRTDVVNKVRRLMAHCMCRTCAILLTFPHLVLADTCGGPIHEEYSEICRRWNGRLSICNCSAQARVCIRSTNQYDQ